ncbi:hypothetical protein I4U23_017312 [Adineta vaga]|nr:hypothetical protein I4U23_017312 [Adineta vaga]
MKLSNDKDIKDESNENDPEDSYLINLKNENDNLMKQFDHRIEKFQTKIKKTTQELKTITQEIKQMNHDLTQLIFEKEQKQNEYYHLLNDYKCTTKNKSQNRQKFVKRIKRVGMSERK